MTIHNVKVLAGFRLLFTAEQWEEFCVKLQEHVNGDENDDDGSDSGSDSGSETGSGSDSGSEHDDHDDCESVDVDEALEQVYDNFDAYFKEIFGEYAVKTHYNVTACTKNESCNTDRMIDIGFNIGEFIFADNDGSCADLDAVLFSVNESKKKAFAKKLKSTLLWEYCSNTDGAQVLSQPDGCVYCKD